MKTNKLPSVIRKVLEYRRRSRLNFVLSKVSVVNKMKVLDIGCGIDGRSFDDYVPEDFEITGVDIIPGELVHHKHPRFSYIYQDAQDLSRFKDNEFDLAISIGMLEHITVETVFKSIVSELRRVAKQHIVVVPYKYCWVEPHFGVPFFPLLTDTIQNAIVKAFNLSKLRKIISINPMYISRNYRWLSNAQYMEEFPDSKIYLLPTLEMIAIIRSS